MHLFILLSVGPLGDGVYHVIWPWNISCFVVLVVLLRTRPEPVGLPTGRGAQGVKNSSWRLVFWTTIVLIWVFPFLFYFPGISYPAYMSYVVFFFFFLFFFFFFFFFFF
jgi:hypothetical protein